MKSKDIKVGRLYAFQPTNHIRPRKVKAIGPPARSHGQQFIVPVELVDEPDHSLPNHLCPHDHVLPRQIRPWAEVMEERERQRKWRERLAAEYLERIELWGGIPDAMREIFRGSTSVDEDMNSGSGKVRVTFHDPKMAREVIEAVESFRAMRAEEKS